MDNQKELLMQCYAFFKRACGTHTKAAELLKISPSHYRALRHGRVNLTPRMKDYIFNIAKKKGFKEGNSGGGKE